MVAFCQCLCCDICIYVILCSYVRWVSLQLNDLILTTVNLSVSLLTTCLEQNVHAEPLI